MDAIKQEADEKPLKTNDYWLKEWTELEEVKADLKELHDPALTSRVKEEGSDKIESVNSNEHSGPLRKSSSVEIPKARKSFTGAELANQLDELIEKLCRGAPVSGRVSSLCTFKCLECAETIKGWVMLRQHRREKHGIGVALAHVAELISSVTCHECKLCSAKVFSDMFFIGRHLHIRHFMSAAQYVSRFGFDTSKQAPKVTFSNDKVIGNLCVYACDECGQEFNRPDVMKEHQKKLSHGSSLSKTSLKAITYHKCQLCGKSLISNMKILVGHFRNTHDISSAEYCKRTGCAIIQKDRVLLNSLSHLKDFEVSETIGFKCEFACNICGKKYYNYLTSTSHISKEHQELKSSLIKPSIELVKGFSYKCKICFHLMLCDKKIIKDHMARQHDVKQKDKHINPTNKLQDEYAKYRNSFKSSLPKATAIYESYTVPLSKISLTETTPEFGNLCMFKCQLCDAKVFHSFANLIYHRKTVHNKANKGYSKSAVLTARYHLCLICSKAILNDRHFLQMHVTCKHNVKFLEYERIFRKHNGKTLLSFNAWLRVRHNE